MRICFITLLVVAVLPLQAFGAIFMAYSNDFDNPESFYSGVSGGFSGVESIESVQGYNGNGNSGTFFAGNFLRNASSGHPAASTFLSLTGLPTHDSVSLGFLLAIIDSWDDGIGSFPGPDHFLVKIDGVTVFDGGFSNQPTQSQTYIPPPGVSVFARPFPQLGFNTLDGSFTEAAYNLGLDPLLQNISHSASTLNVEFFATAGSGPFQGGTDESWAIENVKVSLDNSTVPEPSTGLICALGLLGAIVFGKRRMIGGVSAE